MTELTSKTVVLAALGSVTGVYILEELLRLRGKSVPLITAFTLKMCHPDETTHFISRPVYLAVGVILALLIFPENVAYASITILAVGDPVAGYVGEKFGRRHIRQKSLEGFAAGLTAAFFATLLLVPPFLGFVGSTAGLLIELLGGLDDNLTMPLIAGAAMILTSLFWPSMVI